LAVCNVSPELCSSIHNNDSISSYHPKFPLHDSVPSSQESQYVDPKSQSSCYHRFPTHLACSQANSFTKPQSLAQTLHRFMMDNYESIYMTYTSLSVYQGHLNGHTDLDISAELHAANSSIHEDRPPHQTPPILMCNQESCFICQVSASPQQTQTCQVPILSARQYQQQFAKGSALPLQGQLHQLSSMDHNPKHVTAKTPAAVKNAQSACSGTVSYGHWGPSTNSSSFQQFRVRDTASYTHTLRNGLRETITALQGIIDIVYPFTAAESTRVLDQIRDLIRDETTCINKVFAASILTAQPLKDSGLDFQPALPSYKDYHGESIPSLRPHFGEIRENVEDFNIQVNPMPQSTRVNYECSGSNGYGKHSLHGSPIFQFETLRTIYTRRMLAVSQLKNLRTTLEEALDLTEDQKSNWPASRYVDSPAYALKHGTASFLTCITHEYREWQTLWDALFIAFEQAKSLVHRLDKLSKLWVPVKPGSRSVAGPDNSLLSVPLAPTTSGGPLRKPAQQKAKPGRERLGTGMAAGKQVRNHAGPQTGLGPYWGQVSEREAVHWSNAGSVSGPGSSRAVTDQESRMPPNSTRQVIPMIVGRPQVQPPTRGGFKAPTAVMNTRHLSPPKRTGEEKKAPTRRRLVMKKHLTKSQDTGCNEN
jgi:hypothetical protein